MASAIVTVADSRDQAPRPLILASASPRRRRLLEEAGVAFEVVAPSVDERALPGEAPEGLTRRLAERKARSVAARVPEAAAVLAADTLVVLEDEILGKPRDAADARAMLRRLAGNTHRVVTGYAVLCDGCVEAGVEVSRVQMRPISAEEVSRYVATGEPMDKAGSYALQGAGGDFVVAVEGLRSNVIGLPLERVLPVLRRLGIPTA